SSARGLEGLLEVGEVDRVETPAQERRELKTDQDLARALPIHDHVEIRFSPDEDGLRLAVHGQDIADAVVLQVPEDPRQVLVQLPTPDNPDGRVRGLIRHEHWPPPAVGPLLSTGPILTAPMMRCDAIRDDAMRRDAVLEPLMTKGEPES